MKGKWILMVDRANCEQHDLKQSLAEFDALIQGEVAATIAYDAQGKSENAFVARSHIWLAVYDVLKNTNEVHTASLFDISECEKALFKVAQSIDRLPQENSLTTLVLLRRAWVLYDLFHTASHVYKRLAKIAYITALLLNVAVVTITTLSCANEETVISTQRKPILLVLSLLTAGVTSWNALY